MSRTVATIAALLVLLYFALSALSSRGPAEPADRVPAASASATRGGTGSVTPTARGLTITFSEEQLTETARRYTPMTVSGITVTDPVVRLEPGRLTLTATGRVFIFSGPIVVRATPLITDGKPAVRIDSATFAGRELPDSTKQEIADTFARTLASNIPAGVRVTALTVGSGSLTVQTAPL